MVSHTHCYIHTVTHTYFSYLTTDFPPVCVWVYSPKSLLVLVTLLVHQVVAGIYSPSDFTGPLTCPYSPSDFTGPLTCPYSPSDFTGPLTCPYSPSDFTGPLTCPYSPTHIVTLLVH